MDRYAEKKVERIDRGKVYTITLTDEVDKNTRILTTYTPRIAQRFDNIAQEFYGDPRKWFIIARANNEVKGKLFATPGKKLIIPKI